MPKFNWLVIAVAMLGSIAVAQSARPDASAALPNSEASLAEGHDYHIRAGDQLEIKFFYQPELNEQVIVRPDGQFTLQLIHDVKAEGLTIPELTKIITDAYAKELKEPQVAVILRATGARIYVDGEVNRAGPQVYLTQMNIVQAVSEAGGLRDTARRDQLLVIRPNNDAPPTIIAVNYKKALMGDMHELANLRPSDIVVVPRSRVSDVNSWVDRYLRKNMPIPVNLGWYRGLP
jgi:polysaccharide export outer membrane protein